MERKVLWAELQSELSDVGLNILVGLPEEGNSWQGEIDGKPFLMTISPKNEKDGFRDFMIISLPLQEDEKIVPFLSKFMGYKPFCKYLRKGIESFITYEWDKKSPNDRLKELREDTDVDNLRISEEGFQTPQAQSMEMFFQQITPEIVKKWEEVVQKNAKAEWNYNRICDVLPFVKKVMPRIGQNQSLFGLSIISLDCKPQNMEEIIQYGLEPLLAADILTKEEVKQVVNWYLQEAHNSGHFQKKFEIGEVKYGLVTDSHNGYLDFNLQVLK
ncbi:MAG: hypothetical protein WC697_02195 [Patescibacteria group bacterium]|jgi:hypothetical protein